MTAAAPGLPWAPWPCLGPPGERASVTLLRALLRHPADPERMDAELDALIERDPAGMVFAVLEVQDLVTAAATRVGVPVPPAGLVRGWTN